MFDELSGQVFLPEQLTTIQTAYNQACKILVAAGEFGSPPTSDDQKPRDRNPGHRRFR